MQQLRFVGISNLSGNFTGVFFISLVYYKTLEVELNFIEIMHTVGFERGYRVSGATALPTATLGPIC